MYSQQQARAKLSRSTWPSLATPSGDCCRWQAALHLSELALKCARQLGELAGNKSPQFASALGSNACRLGRPRRPPFHVNVASRLTQEGERAFVRLYQTTVRLALITSYPHRRRQLTVHWPLKMWINIQTELCPAAREPSVRSSQCSPFWLDLTHSDTDGGTAVGN